MKKYNKFLTFTFKDAYIHVKFVEKKKIKGNQCTNLEIIMISVHLKRFDVLALEMKKVKIYLFI